MHGGTSDDNWCLMAMKWPRTKSVSTSSIPTRSSAAARLFCGTGFPRGWQDPSLLSSPHVHHCWLQQSDELCAHLRCWQRDVYTNTWKWNTDQNISTEPSKQGHTMESTCQMKKFCLWHDCPSSSLAGDDFTDRNWPQPSPHHKWRLLFRFKIIKI